MPNHSEIEMQFVDAAAPPGDGIFSGDASPLQVTASPKARWWLWWNLLSLDAPAIAAAWALLFARSRHVAVGGGCIVLLAAAVWLVYVADRILDGCTADASALRERHFFYAAHKKFFVSVSFAVAFLGLCFAHAVLTNSEWRAGLALTGAVGIYLVAVHWGRRLFPVPAPKELVVAVVFAAGTTLPLWSQPQIISFRSLMAWTLFAVLCALNCVAIEFWESNRASVPSVVVSWVGNRLGVISIVLALLSLGSFILRDPNRSSGQGLIAVVVGALFLLMLNQRRAGFSAAAVHVLADVALFAPACILLLFRHA